MDTPLLTQRASPTCRNRTLHPSYGGTQTVEVEHSEDDLKNLLRNRRNMQPSTHSSATSTLSLSSSSYSPCLFAYSILTVFFLAICVFTYHLDYSLPTPSSLDVDFATNSRFSEHNAREAIRYLANDIGYRVVGTEGEFLAKQYILDKLDEYQSQARVERTRNENIPNFDLWVQVGNGSHRFDMMGKVVMKMYTNVTNIIVRLSCGPRCDENSVLVNAHYDTTLGSPGAADDAIGVGVMLEMIRILSLSDTPRKNSAIFLFNGGEESLQDASHSFITNHELKDKVRAVINLEACGTTGREILFQANSLEMIEAYRTVPHPHGTVMANDVFSTGLILSDTDFRQFVDYGNLTGLDMAVYKNSYLYHTHLDVEDHLQPGTTQHMGENAMALMNYLTTKASLEHIEPTNEVVFFDVFGQFFLVYSWPIALASHIIIGLGSVFLLATRQNPTALSIRGTLSVPLSALAAILFPNLTAMFFVAIDKPMRWFSHEWLPILLFCPSALAGMFFVQYLFHDRSVGTRQMEYKTFCGVLFFFTALMGATSWYKIASSYSFAIYTLAYWIGLAVNDLVLTKPADSKTFLSVFSINHYNYKRGIALPTYFIASLLPTTYFTYCAYSLHDLFIPLMGRVGVDAPVDHIVASMIGFTTFVFCPILLAFSHRYGKEILKKLVVGLVLVHVAITLVSTAVLFPFDEMHPKRVFAQHLKNLTSGESLMYIAQADPGPFYDPIVKDLEMAFGVPSTFHDHHESPGDWNSLYPFSQFLDSYSLDTAPYIRRTTSNDTLSRTPGPLTQFVWPVPQLYAENVVYDPATGTKRMTLLCTHESYIWTVISFDAHVTSWSIPGTFPFPYANHYVVRQAGGYVSNAWRLDLEFKVDGPDDKLRVELTAIEMEGFGKDEEREIVGGGNVGVMRKVKKTVPKWATLTYFGTVVAVFDL